MLISIMRTDLLFFEFVYQVVRGKLINVLDLDDGVKVNYEKFQGIEVAQEGKKAVKVDLLAKMK